MTVAASSGRLHGHRGWRRITARSARRGAERGAAADQVIDGRRFVATPGLLQRAHAHQLRPCRSRHLPGRSREPPEVRLRPPGRDDRGGGVPHHPPRPGRAAQDGTTSFLDPGSTKFVDACLQAYEDAGIRVIMGECVTDQESSLSLPRASPHLRFEHGFLTPCPRSPCPGLLVPGRASGPRRIPEDCTASRLSCCLPASSPTGLPCSAVFPSQCPWCGRSDEATAMAFIPPPP